MTCEEAIAYIHSLLKFGMKPGMERMEALLHAIGHPERKIKVIHVAGTNGKGSTATMIAGALTHAGYKVGLFTSPYVMDFRERIQIDGCMIPPDTLAGLTQHLQPVAEAKRKQGNGPTEFEFITGLALQYFAAEDCDYVVLEVGLGGLLDSTNVIARPLCAVICNVALDHTDILGETVQKIAAQKAGIIKAGCPVVIGPQTFPEALEILVQAAEAKNAPYCICKASDATILEENAAGVVFSYTGNRYQTGMPGLHQVRNAITALEALAAVRPDLPEASAAAGIASARLAARQEWLAPDCLLDGGHNPDGAAALAKTLAAHGNKFHALLGMMADKDVPGYLEQIAPYLQDAVTVTVGTNPRSLTGAALAGFLWAYNDYVSVAVDYDSALKMLFSKEDGLPYLICGSFYLAGDIRQQVLEILKNRTD